MSTSTPKTHFVSLVAATVIVAVCGAKPYAGSWNDGSRLAAVEAIADHGTFAIDDSIFVHVPDEETSRGAAPYPPDRTDLLRDGTKDKLLISGRFYSDKPYSVSLVLAAVYRGLQSCGFPRAAERPDLFCWTMTILTSGTAYICAALCMYCTGRLIGLSMRMNTLWVLSFAFATFAATYSRHVNAHIMMLAVTAGVVLQLTRMRDDLQRHRWSGPLWLGILSGAGVCLDPGGGPLLLGCLTVYVMLRFRHLLPGVVLVLSAAPFVILQIGLNWRIGGVLIPINMVAGYAAWPGSPFSSENLTGFWRHSPAGFVLYAASMLFGKHGVIGHNLPLFLVFPAIRRLCRQPRTDQAEPLVGLVWCVATWLLYAALSNNSSGACCSIRWFVPFLAPAYLVLGQDLQAHPHRWKAFLAFSGWGGAMAAVMWWQGPWTFRMVPGYWFFVAAALITWLLINRSTRVAADFRQESSADPARHRLMERIPVAR